MGTVNSVSGINCGATCVQSYSFGTLVTLNATASAGSAFTGWSGTGAGTAVQGSARTLRRVIDAV